MGLGLRSVSRIRVSWGDVVPYWTGMRRLLRYKRDSSRLGVAAMAPPPSVVYELDRVWTLRNDGAACTRNELHMLCMIW